MTEDTKPYNQLTQAVYKNPKFQTLVKRRQRFNITLSAIMLIAYFGLIITIGVWPEILAKPLFTNSVTTIGIPAGLCIIVLAIILTGIYVYRTNRIYDKLNNEVLKEATDETFK